MLIVSQDNKTVVNLSVIESIFTTDKNEIIAAGICNDNDYSNLYTIATYEIQQKAKDALRQIWSAYANGDKVFMMP